MCITCGCGGNGHQLLAFKSGGTRANPATLKLAAVPSVNETLAPPVLEAPAPTKTLVEIERDVLGKNNKMAERNRGYFEARNIRAYNLVSSPGSGKTSILERTLKAIGKKVRFYVIEGDQQTARDAERIAASGAAVVQINTGKGCHLEAQMVNEALRQLNPEANSVMMIENVGNLVCPAAFDLGENARVVVISITEGEDKPIKYPDMFYSADLCLINKIDLLPYLTFDLEALKNYARQVNPGLRFIEVSATTGAGMDAWYQYLLEQNTTQS